MTRVTQGTIAAIAVVKALIKLTMVLAEGKNEHDPLTEVNAQSIVETWLAAMVADDSKQTQDNT